MRISHRYKLIFLATPRTGSTSIRKVLDDVSDIKSININYINENFPFYHHISARELKEIFEKRGWNWFDYRKFCVVRNPFDRVVSLYHHSQKMKYNSFLNKLKKSQGIEYYKILFKYNYRKLDPRKFEKYVMKLNPNKNRLAQSIKEFTCDSNGFSLIDDIFKFENLQLELPNYLKRIGISSKSYQLPHLNSSQRKSYRKYYNKQTKNRVEKLYKYEIETFGYEF